MPSLRNYVFLCSTFTRNLRKLENIKLKMLKHKTFKIELKLFGKNYIRVGKMCLLSLLGLGEHPLELLLS